MDKSSEAFRTITEVAESLDLPQHVLRFWETRFTQIKPLKRAGGRRYYRPEDVQLITAIRRLLYDEGFTIRGVQRLLREKGAKAMTSGAVVAEAAGSGSGDKAASGGARGGAEPIDLDDEAGGEGAEHAGADSMIAGMWDGSNLDRTVLQALLEELTQCRRILEGVLHPQR
jgi:DNA-binding transcriptional MerR regulator